MAESASSLDPPLLVPNDVFGEAMDDHNEEADERESEDEVTSITDDDFLTNCLDPLVEDFGDQNHEETNALEPSESAQNIIGLITDGRFDTYDGFNDHLDIPSSYLNESIPSSLSKPVNFRDFEPWYENVSNLLHEEPEQDIVHDLVLNYLITEGYGEVAEALCEESGLVCPEDSNNVQDRMEIRKAIVDEGDIDRALTMLNTLTPGLLDQDPDVGFLIKQQQIIELVRNEKLHEALTLGEKCMAHASQMGESLIQEMEKTFSLLAFDEPEKSLYGSLMDPLHRQLVANSVNSAVLKVKISLIL
ncbi:hypothetical protein L596_012129 [Steinernema carpocapsae]|uniref:CTLH domain-containing protein n=1 Tax=Steinernema carpocapsae TaxID=34508 RepID=A0A4U5NWX4_STECR|nr:hypothetical protein L596_012129 [Steinernema carpocapsae]